MIDKSNCSQVLGRDVADHRFLILKKNNLAILGSPKLIWNMLSSHLLVPSMSEVLEGRIRNNMDSTSGLGANSQITQLLDSLPRESACNPLPTDSIPEDISKILMHLSAFATLHPKPAFHLPVLCAATSQEEFLPEPGSEGEPSCTRVGAPLHSLAGGSPNAIEPRPTLGDCIDCSTREKPLTQVSLTSKPALKFLSDCPSNEFGLEGDDSPGGYDEALDNGFQDGLNLKRMNTGKSTRKVILKPRNASESGHSSQLKKVSFSKEMTIRYIPKEKAELLDDCEVAPQEKTLFRRTSTFSWRGVD